MLFRKHFILFVKKKGFFPDDSPYESVVKTNGFWSRPLNSKSFISWPLLVPPRGYIDATRWPCVVESLLRYNEASSHCEGMNQTDVMVGYFFAVSAVHFAAYLTGLCSMRLIWAAGARCKWRAHLYNRVPPCYEDARTADSV